MNCLVCESSNQAEFPTEIAIHFAGPTDLNTPHVFISPKALVCLDCGFSQFAVPETELRELREGIAPTNAA
jgi:hypothetical protein